MLLLYKRKNKEIMFFALFWLFSGLTFFTNQLNDFFWAVYGYVPDQILHPINQVSIGLQGLFLFAFLLLQLTKNWSLTKKLLMPVIILIIVFIYFNQRNAFDGPIISDWGVEYLPLTFFGQASSQIPIPIRTLVLE